MGEAGHRFSRRTAWELGASDFSVAVAEARLAAKEQGRELIDLTVSNPTLCGFEYDEDAVLGVFQSKERMASALVYDPDPRGLRSAREAVAQYYADHAADVDAEQIVLTTSTSEAYSFLFRLLCDAGDEVLVARPSYPLFEFLADLDDVQLREYPLFYDFGWWIDFAELERSIGPRTRAILVVNPNNPTGHWTRRAERERLETLCVRHGLALIVDEVFLDYPIASEVREDVEPQSFALGPHPALTFVLSGISKIAALPQMKVAWLASFGPQKAVAETMSRLEVIADTFLSMNAPMQMALPSWLTAREDIQQQIRNRVETNQERLRRSGIEVLHVEAGWAAILLLRPGTDHACNFGGGAKVLLERLRVITHPGSFYGLPDGRMVAVSLITPEALFEEAIRRIRGSD